MSNNERAAAKKFGITTFPKLLFFKHREPTVYQGDLMNEEQVLEWLTSESIDMHDKIELATARSLPSIIDSQDYVAVLFCKCCPVNRSCCHGPPVSNCDRIVSVGGQESERERDSMSHSFTCCLDSQISLSSFPLFPPLITDW